MVHISLFFGNPAFHKVSQSLYGCGIISSACLKGLFLYSSLEFHSRKYVVGREILGSYLHQQSAVGILRISGIFAHSVYHQSAFFGCGRYHISSGTHTKCINSPACLCGICQHIIGRRKQLCSLSILGSAYVALSVLNTHAHCKGLLFKGYAFFSQLIKCVSGTVAHRQYKAVGLYFSLVGYYRRYSAIRAFYGA